MAKLKLQYGVISTDEHVQEAPDVWTSRMSKAQFGDDIPHLVERPDGTQVWLIAGQPAMKPPYEVAIVTGAMHGRDPKRWEEVPPSTYVPAERLKVMDEEEVDTHTFFPNIAGLTNNKFQNEGSEDFRLACIRAYNDWLADEWTGFSPRFIAQCITPMWSAELAAAEIERAVKRGHKGVVWHGAPDRLGFPHFNEPYWDPVYRICEDLGVPMCLHQGAMPVYPAWEKFPENTRVAVQSTKSFTNNMQVITNVLFSGVLDRFPKLKLITVESGIGWIPYLLETCDHEYERLHVRADGLRTKPSEAFRRNIWANFWFESFGMQNRHAIGVDNILYETDFPHPTSTWPNSKACREEALKGVPAAERRKMLVDNAVKLYQLEVEG